MQFRVMLTQPVAIMGEQCRMWISELAALARVPCAHQHIYMCLSYSKTDRACHLAACSLWQHLMIFSDERWVDLTHALLMQGRYTIPELCPDTVGICHYLNQRECYDLL